MKKSYVFRTKRRYILLGILAALFLFFLSQVIKLLPFDYLDFSDAPGVTIVDYGEQDKLYFADPMPTSYQIDRPTYSLQVHMGSFEVIPRVHITALNGTAILAGDLAKTGDCTGFSWGGNKKFHDELVFNWYGYREAQKTVCANLGPGSEELMMTFRVKDQSGEIFEEKLPFVMTRNGYTLWFDAI